MLVNLKSIDLSNNKLQTIVPELFEKNNLLQSINLSNNSIVWIQGSWMHLGRLTYVNVRNNKLTTYNRLIFKKFTSKQSSKTLFLKNNNFTCGCDLGWMFDTGMYFVNFTADPDVMCSDNIYNFTEIIILSPIYVSKYKNAEDITRLYRECSHG